MLYRKILSQAWKITWRHKFLWFFGLFATLLANSGEYNILWRGFSGGEENDFLFWEKLNRFNLGQYSSNALALARSDPLTMLKVLVALFILLVLVLFFIWLTVVSQAAIVKSTASISSGAKISFGEAVTEGVSNFWPVLWLNIISRVVIGCGFLFLSFLIVFSTSQTGSGFASLFYLLLFIILFPISLAFTLLIKYSIAYVVIKKEKFINSMRMGWELFKQNWLISLEMAFILFFIYFFASLAIILLTLTLATPFLFLAFLFYQLGGMFSFWSIVSLGILIMLAIIIIGGSILTTFQVSSWTTLFMELVSKGGVSKIVRVVTGLMERKNN